MVDGDAAQAFGDLFRERWRRATKESLPQPEDAGGDPWPEHVPAALTKVDIAIARTEPAWKKRPLVDEWRRLTLACIAEAKQVIYMENQYFTSPLVTEALAARLAEPDGPEVVLISTGEAPSWFDRATMDRARGSMIWRLRAADIFGRFRAFFPTTPGGEHIIVHSKTSVFDDRIARVGSANLNNRSGGFDTEVELVIECDEEQAKLSIGAFRDRLVGHYMGYTGDAVARARADFGGLAPAIDALNREGRLLPIEPAQKTAFSEFVSAYHICDPSDVKDSWRLGSRRENLFQEARAIAQAAAAQKITGLGAV